VINNSALSYVLKKCNQTLSLFLYEVVECIIKCTKYMSLDESRNDFFLRDENCKILKRRRISDNFFDIIDDKFNFKKY